MAVADEVRAIFDAMPANLNVNATKGMNSVIQFEMSGEGGGNYYLHINDGKCSVTEGRHASPNMTMTMTAQDYVDMIRGTLNGQTAFISGKLRVTGDMNLAMNMQNLFMRPADMHSLSGLMDNSVFAECGLSKLDEAELQRLEQWVANLVEELRCKQPAVGTISSIMQGGKVIELDDGSLWKVAGCDRSIAESWSEFEEIVVLNDRMFRVDESESAEVQRLE